MTSVAVISSAVASIRCLKDLHHKSSRWPNEADEMSKELQEMKDLLANDPRTQTEAAEQNIKDVVRLSYEVVDAVADSLKPSSSRILDQLARSSGVMKLRYLREMLKGLRGELAKIDASPPSKEANVPVLGRKNSGRGKTYKQYFPSKVKKKNKPDSATGSQAQPAESVAGSETKRENAAVFDLLKKELLEPPKDHSREVYIVGESGMGKSTLARKLYNDPEIQKSFDVFGWVTMEHNFQIKRVLQLLLKQLGPELEEQLDLSEMNEIQLISLIFDVINDDRSYLLVLDDVGAVEDWNSIRPALPLALPRANLTRVIITTSSTEFVSRPHHHTVSGLTLPETVTLLEKEASFEPGSEEVGKAIYEISGGSPLYATILGKSLKSEAKDERLAKELRSYESKKGTPQVLEACYKRLDPRLKPCLLYLGQFPLGQDIQFEKLYLLLVAEKLILPQEESEVTPKSLSDCLYELARLSLVQVEEDIVLSRRGICKSCRIHKQVGEFCKSMGLDEEFFQVLESDQQVLGPHTRRLAINYRGGGSVRFEGDDDAEKNILSLLIFDTIEAEGPWEINDLGDLSRLRVLSFDEVNFGRRKLPRGLGKLLLLRLLSFRGCIMEELPSSLRKLTQVETLDLLVRDECDVIITGNIFAGMNRMVHLFLPPSLTYRGNGDKGKLTLGGMEMLETLVNFDTEIFEVGDLSELKKLKILSTISNGENAEEMDAVVDLLNRRGEQLQHSSVEIRGFDCYDEGCVSALKKLLQCRFVHSVRIEGQIGEMPEEEDDAEFDERSVAEMVLNGSELEDEPMAYFGKFPNLRSLELANDAYIGTEILISPSPLFPKLRRLKLRNLQELEKLTIEEGALPQLSSLQIESCGDDLELTIPKGLYQRLKNETGGDAYSVVPSPSKFNTMP